MTTVKKSFGNGEYKVQYGTIVDHGTYEHLRIMVELDTGDSTVCNISLNGVTIGRVKYLGKKQYQANREHTSKIFKNLGLAIAAIVSNFHS